MCLHYLILQSRYSFTVWTAWSDWSVCDVTCGRGIQERERHCLGDACPVHVTKINRRCANKTPCPGEYRAILSSKQTNFFLLHKFFSLMKI